MFFHQEEWHEHFDHSLLERNIFLVAIELKQFVNILMQSFTIF